MTLRSSQLSLETLGIGVTRVRVSAISFEVLTVPHSSPLSSTYTALEVLTSGTRSPRASGLILEVLGGPMPLRPYVLPDNTLPWTIAPDWANGVTERLAWKTDILASETGAEQRRQLRTAPRLTMEADYQVIRRDRRLLDALLTGPANTLWQVPMWWERFPIYAGVAAGDTVLPLLHSYADLQAGDTVMLLGSTPQNYELAKIASVSDNGTYVVLAGSLVQQWPNSTPVYLTRRCRLADKAQATRRANDAFEIKLGFECIDPVDHAEFVPAETYMTAPLMLEFTPDFANDLTVDYVRLYESFDNETGRTTRRDLGLRAFHVMQFEHIAFDRREARRFRGFLYYLRGKLREVHVPTFSIDVEFLSYATAVASDTNIFVIAAGYSQYLEGEPDRNVLAIYYNDGTIILRHVTAATYLGSDGRGNYVESLQFDIPLGRETSIYTMSKISYVQLMRQDQDEFEINHVTEGSGVTKFSTTFRSVGPGRGATPYSIDFSGTYIKNPDPAVLPVTIVKAEPKVTDPAATDTYKPSVSGGLEGGQADGPGDGSGAGQGEDGEGAF